MMRETNGGNLKSYKARCLKGICNETVDVEEIGYLNGTMHVRRVKCGYIKQSENLIHI